MDHRLLGKPASAVTALDSGVVAPRLSCSMACKIFHVQEGYNPCPLHCERVPIHGAWGSPSKLIFKNRFWFRWGKLN